MALLCVFYGMDGAARGWPLYASVGVTYSATDGTAHTDSNIVGGFPPASLPLDGLPFDDEDVGWSAGLGYQFVDFFAVEFGYEDLGSFESSANFAMFGDSERPDAPSISAEGYFLKAQFQYPLTDRLLATWHAGIVRAEFEAEGVTRVGISSPIFPPFPIEIIEIPFSDPGRETGYLFGFGLGWKFSRHFDAELYYTRRDLEVLKFDSVGLRAIARL